MPKNKARRTFRLFNWMFVFDDGLLTSIHKRDHDMQGPCWRCIWWDGEHL